MREWLGICPSCNIILLPQYTILNHIFLEIVHHIPMLISETVALQSDFFHQRNATGPFLISHRYYAPISSWSCKFQCINQWDAAQSSWCRLDTMLVLVGMTPAPCESTTETSLHFHRYSCKYYADISRCSFRCKFIHHWDTAKLYIPCLCQQHGSYVLWAYHRDVTKSSWVCSWILCSYTHA